MFILFTFLQFNVMMQAANIITDNLVELENRFLRPDICFEPSPDTSWLAENQVISCILAMPGQFPPLEARYSQLTHRCCFRGEPENGIFWAVGESVMSEIIATKIQTDDNTPRPIHHPFDLKSAQLLDIRVLDATTDAAIRGARVSVSNDAVHLVSYTKMTDSDGYAVFPVIPGSEWVAMIRADGYLTPSPVYFSSLGIENEERIVELDPGISISGKVLSPHETPVSSARLHVEVDRPNQLPWNSEIDLPRPISSLADGSGWNPARGSWSSADNGYFHLKTIPRGRIRIYASHEQYAPSSWVTIDASDNDDLKPVTISLKQPQRAWIRVENPQHAAIAANLTVYDDATGCEVTSVKTPTSGALELKNLPSKARFFITSDTSIPLQDIREIHDQDEITIVLEQSSTMTVEASAKNEDGIAIHHATLSPASAEIRKKFPACLGKTDSSGTAVLEMCPQSFWMDIYHPDYAHILKYVDANAPANFILKKGKDIDIEILDELNGNRLSNILCTIDTTFQSGEETQVLSEKFKAADGRLAMTHRPDEKQHLNCIWNTEQISIDDVPENFPKSLKFPHFETRRAIVIDNFGSPVPYARLSINGQMLETDETGRIELSAKPDSSIRFYHWQHGSGSSVFAAGNSELELRLPDVPDKDVVSCLDDRHIPYVIDSSQILLDIADTKHHIERGDAVEICTSKNLVIVRNGRRMDIPWK